MLEVNLLLCVAIYNRKRKENTGCLIAIFTIMSVRNAFLITTESMRYSHILFLIFL